MNTKDVEIFQLYYNIDDEGYLLKEEPININKKAVKKKNLNKSLSSENEKIIQQRINFNDV